MIIFLLSILSVTEIQSSNEKKNPFILSRYPDITNKAKTSHEKRLGQLQVSGNPFERCIIDG